MRDFDDLQQVPTIISRYNKIIPKLGNQSREGIEKNGAYTALKLSPLQDRNKRKIMLKCLHHKFCE